MSSLHAVLATESCAEPARAPETQPREFICNPPLHLEMANRFIVEMGNPNDFEWFENERGEERS